MRGVSVSACLKVAATLAAVVIAPLSVAAQQAGGGPTVSGTPSYTQPTPLESPQAANCADAAFSCAAEPQDAYAKLKDKFKKRDKNDRPRVCDVVVFIDPASGVYHFAVVADVTPDGTVAVIGQTGPTGNVTLSNLADAGGKGGDAAPNIEYYHPDPPPDNPPQDAIDKAHNDAVDKGGDKPQTDDQKKRWIHLWELCRDRNAAIAGGNDKEKNKQPSGGGAEAPKTEKTTGKSDTEKPEKHPKKSVTKKSSRKHARRETKTGGKADTGSAGGSGGFSISIGIGGFGRSGHGHRGEGRSGDR